MVDVIRVLYVDDNPDLLELGTYYLLKSGDFNITTAESASDALNLLQCSHFDAIISDYQMPVMDGIHFFTEVRRRHGRIPFILLIEKDSENVVAEAIDNCVDHYIQKGSDLAEQYAELAYEIRSAVKQYTL
jgi:CheY-like chemotaxis protein